MKDTAQTKKEWEAEQLRMEQSDKDLVVRTDLQRAERAVEVRELDEAAVNATILRVLTAHPTEFEMILLDERKVRGIDKEVESKLGKFLLKLDNQLRL